MSNDRQDLYRPSSETAFYKHLAQTTPEATGIPIVRADGIYLYGPNGEQYMDAISGICVNNVGHNAPEVVQAIKDQSEKYLHPMVYGEYILEPQIAYATKLLEVLNGAFESVYFTNSGTEAIEGALKLAKRYTGRQEIISCWNSYHGSTHGSLSVSGNLERKQGYGPLLPMVRFIRYNAWEDVKQITEQTACVIIEALQGAGGMIVPQPGYLQAVKERCESVGALMILDEIQTGFGRTGSLFAHQFEEVVPDILVLAKALGAGIPLGAFIARKEVMQVLSHDPMLGHITTYGGNPLACAAGLALLNKVIDEELVGQIPNKEAIILNKLKHYRIRKLRGRGLMYALIMKDFEEVYQLKKAMLRRGMLSCFFLNIDNGLRITPPLTITEEEIHLMITGILKALEDISS